MYPVDRETTARSDPRPVGIRLVVVFGVLLVFAVAVSALRLYMQRPGAFPTGDRAWSVLLTADLYAPETGALVRIAPPWDTRHARLYGQLLLHPGMRQLRTKAERRNRDIMLVANRAGILRLQARFDIHVSQVARPPPVRQTPAESNRAAWLAPEEGIPSDAPAVIRLLESLTEDKPEAGALIDRLFDQIGELIRISSDGSDDGGNALQRRQGTALGATRALVSLLRAAHLPARVVTGLNLSAAADQPRYWCEVYLQGGWHPLDVALGYQGELPPTHVPLRKGSDLVLETENATTMLTSWDVQQTETPRGLLAGDTPRLSDVFDLSRLSPTTREVLALLLLLPLGALATQMLRQLVGIRTYGTFTPTLLALAAVFVDWQTAATVFGLVTLLGIAGRALLPGLALTREPRLSIVFTLVAIAMALTVSLLVHFDPLLDSAVVLLPIVILTTLVDRIYAVADDYGPRVALLRLGWTIAAALISLGILLQAHWGETLLAFPESHAVTIAAIILLGRYRGRHLADLRWLAWLKEPPAAKSARQRSGAQETPGKGTGEGQ